MNAQEAQTFDYYSLANVALLTKVAAAKGCHCEPYKDWFTYRRWQAQGQQVQKGERSTKAMTFVPVKIADPETGEIVKIGKRPWASHLFCRCQVAPVARH